MPRKRIKVAPATAFAVRVHYKCYGPGEAGTVTEAVAELEIEGGCFGCGPDDYCNCESAHVELVVPDCTLCHTKHVMSRP